MEVSTETAQYLADTARIANEMAGPEPDRTCVVQVGDAMTTARLTGVAIGKTFTLPSAVPEKTDESRPRKPVRFLAGYFHEHADGPDPAELPRRTRRMRVPDAHAFHTTDRRRRRRLPA